MSDVEYDYMSDEILGLCSKDVRPGLIQDRSKQRLIAIEKRKSASDEENKKRHKSQASLEVERREKGLQEAIPSDNKGFELLQKMGYKPGGAIGKTALLLLNQVFQKISYKDVKDSLQSLNPGLTLNTEAFYAGLWNIYDISIESLKGAFGVLERLFDSQARIFLMPQQLLIPTTCCRARKVSHPGRSNVKMQLVK